jgi:hypothetical protein
MNKVQLVTVIGDVLTQIDVALQTPGKDNASWQTLYALRKHLDDQQRDLVRISLNENDSDYDTVTKKLSAANTDLKSTLNKFAKVGAIISAVSKISSYVDQILKLATPLA